MKSFSYCLPINIFILPLFFKDLFRIEFHLYSFDLFLFFSLGTLRMLLCCLSLFAMRNLMSFLFSLNVTHLFWGTLRLSQDFPGGPVVRTSCFQVRGQEFDLWLRNLLLKSHMLCGTAYSKSLLPWFWVFGSAVLWHSFLHISLPLESDWVSLWIHSFHQVWNFYLAKFLLLFRLGGLQLLSC